MPFSMTLSLAKAETLPVMFYQKGVKFPCKIVFLKPLLIETAVGKNGTIQNIKNYNFIKYWPVENVGFCILKLNWSHFSKQYVHLNYRYFNYTSTVKHKQSLFGFKVQWNITVNSGRLYIKIRCDFNEIFNFVLVISQNEIISL